MMVLYTWAVDYFLQDSHTAALVLAAETAYIQPTYGNELWSAGGQDPEPQG